MSSQLSRPLRLLVLVFPLVALACGDDDPTTDLGPPASGDTGTPRDSGPADTGSSDDLGTVADLGSDAGPDDSGVDGGGDMGTDGGGGPDGGGDAGPGPDTGPGDASLGVDAGASMTTNMQLAAARSRAAGASNAAVMPALPVRGAVVSYVLPASRSGGNGYFLQRSRVGPAIFVSSGATAPTVTEGDVVDLDVVEVNEANGLAEITGVTNLMVSQMGANTSALVQTITTATDAVSNLDGYESERVELAVRLTGGPGFAGSGFTGYPIDTTGVSGSSSFRLRLPDAVASALDARSGCAMTVNGVMWRFNAEAQPQAYRLTDLRNVSCPMTAVAATSSTAVTLDLGRNIDASSVNTNGSQVTIMGLTVTAASVSGRAVTLTTSPQTTGTSYPVTVASSVRDVTGSSVLAPNNSATFMGYAGQVIINEVYYDDPASDGEEVFTELYGPPGTNLTGYQLIGINGSNGADYQTVSLSGTIPMDGFFVIATGSATGNTLNARDLTANVDWQNGPDAVQLRDGSGMVIDALQYGTAPGFMAGEGSPAMDVPDTSSLSRDAMFTDTNDNASDFSPTMPPTPGS